MGILRYLPDLRLDLDASSCWWWVVLVIRSGGVVVEKIKSDRT